MAAKLDVKNLTVSFKTMNGKVQAVRDISFSLDEGETLAIVGESGSGKSVTSKAIMGISAVNAIIESGQILYDGQDLTKISEEDFNRLRGNKISMVFQDPLSSLNPIVRIGNQLTEAMLLKGATNQKEAKHNFDTHLEILKQYLLSYYKGNEEKINFVNKMINDFNEFEVLHTETENKYNIAASFLTDASEKLKDLSFKIDKKAADKLSRDTKVIISDLKKSYDEYLVTKNDEHFNTLLKYIDDNKSTVGKLVKNKNYESEEVVNFKNKLDELDNIASEALTREKYDFFSLAYFKKFGNNEQLSGTISEQNEFLNDFINKNFMNEFLELAEIGMKYGKDLSNEKKKVLMPEIEQLIQKHDTDEFNIVSFKQDIDKLSEKVKDAYDNLDTKLDNTERTFIVSINDNIEKYNNAILANEKESIRFEKETEKFEKLIAKGQTPDWKVVPKHLIDTVTIKNNLFELLNRLKDVYFKQVDRFVTYTVERYHKRATYLVKYFKDEASKFVYKVTKSIAKAKAIKLMEEVGIAEARSRYYRYPFEFSGGMRQRIVIAIALAADPDILICDEPTTALDVTIQSQILELINKIKKERNLSIIFITHDLGVVANMADKVAVMYAGKIVEYGTSNEVFYEPRHPYTWALLSSMPDLETAEKLEAIPGTPPNMIYPPLGDAFAARNKYAMKIDYEMQPPLFKITDTHYAATWLLHPDAPHIDPPKIVTDRIARMKEETEKYLKAAKEAK